MLSFCKQHTYISTKTHFSTNTHSGLRTMTHKLINNKCLKKARLIYTVCRLLRVKGELRINIAMHCHDDTASDSGHAWASLNGRHITGSRSARECPYRMTEIADNGKYRYWMIE